MGSTRFTENVAAWSVVRQSVADLDALLAPAKLDSLGIAKAFAAVALALHAAVLQSGGTSMRLAAVVKAMDLRTPKSQLQMFLAGAGSASDGSVKDEL